MLVHGFQCRGASVAVLDLPRVIRGAGGCAHRYYTNCAAGCLRVNPTGHFNKTLINSHAISSTRSLSSSLSSPSVGFWYIVEGVQSSLVTVHVYSSLPWWGVIIGTTVVLRCMLTVPLAVHQQKVGAKIELLKPLIKEYMEAIKHNVVVKCRRENQPVEEANRRIRKEVRKMVKELYSQEKCHPLKTFLLPWSQIPLWIVLSLAIRNLCGIGWKVATPDPTVLASLSSEGLLWFSNLTVPDQYSILPIVLASTNLLNIEIHSLRRTDPTRFQRVFTNSFRVLSLSAGIISTQLPTALTLYWTTSSIFSLVQNLLLMAPRIKRALKIPQTPIESKTPYRDLQMLLEFRAKKFMERQKN